MLFTVFATVTIAGAVAALSFRNLVHSVLALTIAFSGLAATYLLLGAQFAGLAQVLVYIGAVSILVVFAILLTRNPRADSSAILAPASGLSLLSSAAIFVLLAWCIRHSATGRRMLPAEPAATMQQIGAALMLRYAMPLELIGLLLTIALIGAVTIALEEGRHGR